MPPIRGPSQRSRRVAPKYPRMPRGLDRAGLTTSCCECSGSDSHPQDRAPLFPSSRPRGRPRPCMTYPLHMHAPGNTRARRLWLPLAGAALAVAAVCAVAVLRPWGASEPVAPAAVAQGEPAVAASVPPAPLVLEEDAR